MKTAQPHALKTKEQVTLSGGSEFVVVVAQNKTCDVKLQDQWQSCTEDINDSPRMILKSAKYGSLK